MENHGLDEQYFLTDIFILKCRHLQRIHIPIGKDSRRHLILTGKNGSGKSSVLEEIREHLKDVGAYYNNWQELKDNLPIEHNKRTKELELPDEKVSNEFKQWVKEYLLDNEFQQLISHKKSSRFLDNVSLLSSDDDMWRKNYFSTPFKVEAHQINGVFTYYYKFPFITAYIPAQRNFDFLKPQTEKSTQAFNFEEQSINKRANEQFIHYLMQKKIQQAFAFTDGRFGEAEQTNIWFQQFETYLYSIFEVPNTKTNEIKLTFNSRNYYFDIKLPDREPIGLQQLSDGFKSIIYILAEILLRIEKIKDDLFSNKRQAQHPEDKAFFANLLRQAEPENIQGVVMIDEVETHLHIALQKQILPILTSFFPNIQFIVTSHSPYVLSSIDNAVVYDLENNNFIDEPLIGFPAEAIVETHFEADKFSNAINQIKSEYENLLSLETPTKKDVQKLQKLRRQLQEIPKFHAHELNILLSETQELYQQKISNYDKLS